MKWKLTTYYITFEGEEGSVTDHFRATFRKARLTKKKVEMLNDLMIKLKIFINYRVVLEREK